MLLIKVLGKVSLHYTNMILLDLKIFLGKNIIIYAIPVFNFSSIIVLLQTILKDVQFFKTLMQNLHILNS
jgi:hypothetical protein